MNQESQVQSDEVVQSNAEQQNEEQIVVSKSAEELARRLKEVSLEAKTNRQKYAEMKKQNEELLKTKLSEQGQYKELAEIWQRKATDMEALATKRTQAFAVSKIADAIQLEAAKAGCVDTDAIIPLLAIDNIPIDDGFNVDKSSVKAMIEDFKKNKPYFFKKESPNIVNATPARPEAPAGRDLSKMTMAERAALLSQLKNQGK